MKNKKLVKDALVKVKETGRCSIPLIQRWLMVSFTEASSIIDELEKKGYIGPKNDSKPREIFI